MELVLQGQDLSGYAEVLFLESIDFLLKVLVVFLFGFDDESVVGSEFVYIVSDYVLDGWVLVVYEASSDLVFDENCVLGFHKDVVLEGLDGLLELGYLFIGCVEVVLGDAFEVPDIHLVFEGLKVDWILSRKE